MITDICAGLQFVVQILSDEFFRCLRGRADDHFYVILGKKIQRPATHSAGNDNVCTQIMKPFGQHAGFMGRRNEGFFIFDLIVFNINQRKFLTVPEVSGKFSLS